MQKTRLVEILRDSGLSEHEASVYLAALTLGPTTILKIAEASGIKRTTVYAVTEALKKRGLMREEMKGWKTYFAAESPEHLEQLMESRKERLNKAFPEFMALYNTEGTASNIKIYEGFEAMKGACEGLIDILSPSDYYLVISHSTTWEELDPKWFYGLLERRASLQPARILMQDCDFARRYKVKDKKFNSETKILPEGTSFSTTMIITPKRLMIHQLVEPLMAIVIENQSIIQMQKELFEIIWKTLL